MALVKCYEKYVMGAGANSFKVATHILLHSKPSDTLNSSDRPKLADVEEELLMKTVFLDDVERPLWFIRQLLNDAITYDEYIARGQKMGIFKQPKLADSGHTQIAGGDLKIFDPGSVVAATQPNSLAKVTLSQILAGIVMLHGIKDAGKSLAALEFINAVTSGRTAFEVFPTNCPPAVVYLLDSETPEGALKARFEQYGLTAAVGKNFFPVSKMELLSLGEADLVLTDAAFRARLEAQMGSLKVKMLVLDNLTTLAESGTIYQQQAIGDILDLAGRLASRGITVVVLHHSKEQAGKEKEQPGTARMRGSRESSIRAHTELVVIGTEQILADENLGTNEVQDAARMDGATIGLHFKVCKLASILKGKTLWFHLPLNGNVWKLLAVTGRDDEPIDITMSISSDHAPEQAAYDAWLNEDAVASADNTPDLGGIIDSMADMPLADSPEQGLSGDAVKVLEYVNIHKKIEVGDARTILGWGETKIRKILNGLVEKEKLIVLYVSPGEATIYGLPG
jgi:hypothetical protein